MVKGGVTFAGGTETRRHRSGTKNRVSKSRSSTAGKHSSSQNTSQSNEESKKSSERREVGRTEVGGAGSGSSSIYKTKRLDPDFAEKVLNLELQIDQGQFNMETVNALLLLYSQAVEFYNGMNDSKFSVYQDRI